MVLAYRKLSYFALIFFIELPAIAGTMSTTESTYNGLYVGGTIGLSNLVNPTNTSYPLAAHHMGATGIIGGGLIGYEYSLSPQTKISLEAFGNANGINTSSIQLYSPASSYRVSARYNAGVRVLPGYQFNPAAQGYIVLGYTNLGYKISDNGDYGYINTSGSTNGFQSGLGMKTSVTQHCSIRFDALYSIYQQTSNVGLSNLTPSGPQVYQNSLSTLEGDLTLLYTFN